MIAIINMDSIILIQQIPQKSNISHTCTGKCLKLLYNNNNNDNNNNNKLNLQALHKFREVHLSQKFAKLIFINSKFGYQFGESTEELPFSKFFLIKGYQFRCVYSKTNQIEKSGIEFRQLSLIQDCPGFIHYPR